MLSLMTALTIREPIGGVAVSSHTGTSPFSPQPTLLRTNVRMLRPNWFWLPSDDAAMLTTRLLLQTAETFDSEPHHKPSNRLSTSHLKTCLSQISTLRKNFPDWARGYQYIFNLCEAFTRYKTNFSHQSYVYMRDWIFYWDSDHGLSIYNLAAKM